MTAATLHTLTGAYVLHALDRFERWPPPPNGWPPPPPEAPTRS
ncbi:hypothetical protein [Peterkaempfera bronchialis]